MPLPIRAFVHVTRCRRGEPPSAHGQAHGQFELWHRAPNRAPGFAARSLLRQKKLAPCLTATPITQVLVFRTSPI